MLKRLTLAGLAAAALAGCADEDPVGLDPLVPPGLVRTVEVVLDAARFIESDTSIVGFSTVAESEFGIVADDYDGVLDAHTLMRVALPLASISYTDTAGKSAKDETPNLVSGQLIARLDTSQVRPDADVSLALYTTAEEWDEESATWTLRVDSGGVTLPWTEPGGTRGALVSAATLDADADSVVFPVDSATLALWSDTTDATRGALLVSETPGTLLRFTDVDLIVRARPSERPDTLVTDTVGLSRGTYIYDPAPAADGKLLVGGTPAWRSYFRIRDRLDTLAVDVPCAGEQTCSVRLADVTINYAGLLLQPTPAPAGFAPDDTVAMELRRVLGGGEIPLARAPVRAFIPPILFQVPPGSFAPDAEPAEIALTPIVRGIIEAAKSAGDEALPATFALLDLDEGDGFGIAAFEPTAAGAAAPKLRLIISVVSEEQVQ